MNFGWFRKNRDIGMLLFRLFVSVRLIYGVIDNVLHWDRMIEFSRFLKSYGFPMPLFCAVLSVYAQLIGGLLILIGWKTRFASVIIIINFLVALIMVHRKDSLEAMTPALAMLFGAVLLLFIGAGKYSVDKKINT
jgi:putative oxidoreductase